MLKVDAVVACDYFVEATVAELAVAALQGAVADATTDWDRLPATVAGVRCRLDLTHFLPVRKTLSSLLRASVTNASPSLGAGSIKPPRGNALVISWLPFPSRQNSLSVSRFVL